MGNPGLGKGKTVPVTSPELGEGAGVTPPPRGGERVAADGDPPGEGVGIPGK